MKLTRKFVTFINQFVKKMSCTNYLKGETFLQLFAFTTLFCEKLNLKSFRKTSEIKTRKKTEKVYPLSSVSPQKTEKPIENSIINRK